jgi:hypothetical protein
MNYYAATDYLIFPSNDYFNSGTIYTALSLNIPVIAYKNKTNEEIQYHVGENWLNLFEGDFSEAVLENVYKLKSNHSVCDLSYFSPKNTVDKMINGYTVILNNET